MNLEGIVVCVLVQKIKEALLGGRIVKIAMPTRSSLLLQVRKGRETIPLLSDFGGPSPLLYLPEVMPENPDSPPSFCMLLRKQLEDGRITKISQLGLDRVIKIEIDTLGAARQIVTKTLIFELTGRNGNVIFAENDIIIDALRHVGRNMSSFRLILPGREYLPPPPQTGLSIVEACPATIINLLSEQVAANCLDGLIACTTGIGKFTALQLLRQSGINPAAEVLSEEEKTALAGAIASLQQLIRQHVEGSRPVYGIVTKQNRMNTASLSRPLLEPSDRLSCICFPSLNDALIAAATLVPLQTSERELLQKTISAMLTRTEKKAAALARDLIEAEDAESYKVKADTLMANIYKLEKGLSSCILANIYTDEELSIELSELHTPVENAQLYYRRYNKFKRAVNEIKKQLAETEDALTYQKSLEASLQTADKKSELAEIKQELVEAGLLPESKKGRRSHTLEKSQPLELTLASGTVMLIGKNNVQNDRVTFVLGKPQDTWFHAKNIPGSHVILKTALREPLTDEMLVAARLAAFFSKARDSSNVPVDFTSRRFVRKPSGAKPGFVIYTNQKTLYVTPDKDEAAVLLNQR